MKLMKISKTTKIVIIGILSIITLLALIFGIIKAIGTRYSRNLNDQEFEELNQQLNQQNYDIRRIRLETNDGRIIEILQNGTLVRIDDNKTDQAVLGFGKLNQLFSSLTEEEIIELYNNQFSSGDTYTITFETKSGNTYIIEIPVDGDDIPDEIEDLIDEIEDTTEDILDPTPYPSFIPTPTPTPTPPPSGTPYPTSAPTSTPTTTPYPTPTPTPGPSSLPAYMTAPPFNCSDYDLIKNTVISNIICIPSP